MQGPNFFSFTRHRGYYLFVVLKAIVCFPGIALLIAGCSSPLIETVPLSTRGNNGITITCNAEKGNQGLKDFRGDVFVHLGLITDSSMHTNEWRYVKFKWGSADSLARSKPAGRNKWTYTIPDIRKFFAVDKNEKILQLAVLFREGNCIDTFCRVLRNDDNSDILIPLEN